MLPQYRMIRDFDLYENDYTEFTNFSAPVFRKDDFLKETQDNELENLHFNSNTRSSKSKSAHIETSFENTMMEQHVLAFKKILQKFMENCYPHLKKVQGKSLANQIFQIEEETNSGQQKMKNLITKDRKYFEEKEKKIFLTDLLYEQKLNEFLSIMCGFTHSQLAMELIFISNLFWQAYIPKQEIGLTECQIKTFVEDLLDSENLSKYWEKIQYLNCKEALITPEVSQEETNQAFKLFVRQFGVTILLVIEEYFKNPYSKDEQDFGNMKRSLNFKDISNDEFSDDEDEEDFSFGQKKRKQ